MPLYTVGLDLGQVSDPTALAVLEHRWDEGEPAFDCPHLRRWPLGTPYPDIVRDVAGVLRTPALGGAALVVDGTGVGRAVVDLFSAAGLAPVPVTIHGGEQVTADEQGGFRVPKRDLAGVLQVLLQGGRLRIARGLPAATLLAAELLNFRVKINLKTAHDTYEAWREGDHDDLVLAVALAAWHAVYRPRNPLDGCLINATARGWYRHRAAP
jgi:hypothetical protein